MLCVYSWSGDEWNRNQINDDPTKTDQTYSSDYSVTSLSAINDLSMNKFYGF